MRVKGRGKRFNVPCRSRRCNEEHLSDWPTVACSHIRKEDAIWPAGVYESHKCGATDAVPTGELMMNGQLSCSHPEKSGHQDRMGPELPNVQAPKP